MGSLSKLFLDFHDENSLTKTYKEKITKGRDALRNKIGNKFEEKGRKKPQHCTQGSYAMKTAIMPLDGDEFDLDNGVYLRGYSTDQDDWPAAQTVHTWVKEAVEKHTSNSPIDKNTCIRVVYEDKYHIDLPIYIMGENSAGDSIAYLAHKSKGWIESDPKAFTAWFQGYVNENGQEIRRMVKYLKAWKDYKNIDIKGMAITILVCNNFSVTEKRDDLSLLDTVTNIIDSLEDSFHCYKPVNLLEEITLLIEALVEQQERMVFSEAEDTLTARLQHQLLKLRNILKAQNQMLTQEKEQIKTLISDISHQIKTPVAAANTFAQLLGDTGLSDEERSEYIATLQMSLEKLTFLTNSLIKMSRLESGIIRLKPEQNSLNDIVMQAVKTVYAKARDKNITITFDCGQTFEALLDFNWTAEAVTNVLDNAVKYTPSGGVVDLKITEYPSYLRLDVSDNGIGIPEEEQAKIFGRFYRGKQSAGVDGVGIGLYLTRDIVNKQNGYIKVASDEKGTTFSLFLKKFREQ